MSRTKSRMLVPGADVLCRLYVDENLSMVDIGRRFERDPKTILYWMRKHGIQTRPRGSNAAVHFPKGHTRSYGRRKGPDELAKLARAARRDSRLPHLTGGKHWLKGAPPELNPKWKGGITPERQAFYRSPEWKAACVIVWKRADARCERCGKDHRERDRRIEPKFHVHHIVSFAVRELRAEPSNLALLCRPCHLFVHSNANVAREWLDSITYCRAAELEIATPSLFDMLSEPEIEEAA